MDWSELEEIEVYLSCYGTLQVSSWQSCRIAVHIPNHVLW